MKSTIKLSPAAFAALLLATLLPGCASEPEKRQEPEGYFATFIDQDGTKKFQFTLDIPHQSQGRRNQSAGGYMSGSSAYGVSGGISASSSMGGGSRYMTREQWDQLNSRLENMLERELNESRYCHQGHQETERLVEPPTVFIRGECKEKASETDRVDFPNNVD
jgi:hypothetical protein